MSNIMYKDEIERAYKVLGYRAEDQNIMDIKGLYEDHIIDGVKRDELLKYNKELAKEYC